MEKHLPAAQPPCRYAHFPTSPCQQAKLRLIRAMRLARASSVPPQVLGTEHQSTVYQYCLAPEESPSPFLCPASSCLETRTEAESILGFFFISLPGLKSQQLFVFMRQPCTGEACLNLAQMSSSTCVMMMHADRDSYRELGAGAIW